MLYRCIPFDKSPEALVERSRLFLQKAGLFGELKDSACGFMENFDLLNYIENSDKTANRWKKLDANAILFWYRHSPHPLGIFGLTADSTSPNNPPMRYSGEVLLMLDTEGRLVLGLWLSCACDICGDRSLCLPLFAWQPPPFIPIQHRRLICYKAAA